MPNRFPILRRLATIAAILVGLPLLLAACGPIYETQYTFHPPGDPVGRQLIGQCRAGQNMCLRDCKMDERSCRREAHRRAEEEYWAYVRKREREGAKIKKSLSSFEHTWQCDADRCEAGCAEEYRDCYVESGGRISTRKVCTAFCDQK